MRQCASQRFRFRPPPSFRRRRQGAVPHSGPRCVCVPGRFVVGESRGPMMRCPAPEERCFFHGRTARGREIVPAASFIDRCAEAEGEWRDVRRSPGRRITTKRPSSASAEDGRLRNRNPLQGGRRPLPIRRCRVRSGSFCPVRIRGRRRAGNFRPRRLSTTALRRAGDFPAVRGRSS